MLEKASLVQIFECRESGAVDSWTWTAWLWTSGGETFSASLEQEPWEAGPEAEPSSYEIVDINSGLELFTFLDESWQLEHDESLTLADWLGIADAVQQLSPRLSDELRVAVRVECDSEDPLPSRTPLERCVSEATWSDPKDDTRLNMWASVGRSRSAYQAISFYVTNYLVRHGRLPWGKHRVKVTFGSVASGADCEPGPMTGGAGTFDQEVTFKKQPV